MIAKTEAPHSVNNPTGLVLTTSLLTLPAYWAGYLINGDTEGMSPHEVSVAEAFEREHGACTGCSEEPFFQHHHDASADGVLAGDCLHYTFTTTEPHDHE